MRNGTETRAPFARFIACNRHGVCSPASNAIVQASAVSVSFPPLFVPWHVHARRQPRQAAAEVQWWYPDEVAEVAALGEQPLASALHSVAKYFQLQTVEVVRLPG